LEGKSVLRSNSAKHGIFALPSGEFSQLPAAVALLSPIDKAGGRNSAATSESGFSDFSGF